MYWSSEPRTSGSRRTERFLPSTGCRTSRFIGPPQRFTDADGSLARFIGGERQLAVPGMLDLDLLFGLDRPVALPASRLHLLARRHGREAMIAILVAVQVVEADYDPTQRAARDVVDLEHSRVVVEQ